MSTQLLQPTEDAITVAQAERRRTPRYRCHGRAEALVLFPETLLQGEIRDISTSGCFLETRARLRLDRYTKVDLNFRINGVPYHTVARIMGVRTGAGVGMEFFFDSQRDEMLFKKLIRSLGSPTLLH